MANNLEIKANKMSKKATITQTAYVHYCTRERLIALVTEANGKIAYDKHNFVVATVKDKKTAEDIVHQVTRELASARKTKAKAESKATSPKNAPTPAKGKANLVTVTVDGVAYQVDKANLVPTAPVKAASKKADKTTAPKRAKGNGFDYGKIKGKTNTDKNKALHATLVGMGMKDSRAKDYQAIWTNRPWAK